MLYYIYRWLTKHNLHTLSLSDIAANTSFRVVVHFLFAAQLRRAWWQVQTLTLQQQWTMNCYSSKRITQVSQFQILKYIYIYIFLRLDQTSSWNFIHPQCIHTQPSAARWSSKDNHHPRIPPYKRAPETEGILYSRVSLINY